MTIASPPFGRTGHRSTRVIFGGAALGRVTQDTADRTLVLRWTLLAALAAVALVLWITFVNLLYLLAQIAVAVDNVGVVDGLRAMVRFIRAGKSA